MMDTKSGRFGLLLYTRSSAKNKRFEGNRMEHNSYCGQGGVEWGDEVC